MNNPEGYVLVQVKQLAQWREWANNVAAWSTKSDRSSEVARLKASISGAMVSATQPTASNAGERDILERIAVEEKSMKQADSDGRFLNAQGHQQAIDAYKFCLAALASKPAEPVAPPDVQFKDVDRWNEDSPRTMNGKLPLSATTPAPAEQTVPDMFWDHDDGENFAYDIGEIVQSYGPGEIVKIDQALRMPTITVRVLPATEEDGDLEYEIIDTDRAARGDEVNQK